MLPYLVCHLIFIVVLLAVFFIGGFFVTVNNWEVHLIPLFIVAALCLCKYYFENCIINILFLFLQSVRCGIVQWPFGSVPEHGSSVA
jgi:hypothetical protein